MNKTPLQKRLTNTLRQELNLPSSLGIIIQGNDILFDNCMLTMEIEGNPTMPPMPEGFNLYEIPVYDPQEGFGNMELRSTGLPSQKYAMPSNQNSKLGYMLNFSLPASTTCPGQTVWCEKNCYANKNTYVFSQPREKYIRNYHKTLKGDFVEQMLGQGNMRTFNNNERKKKVLRLHVSGDFYNNEYIEKWIQIVEASPDWSFYGYTKSWRIPEMQPKLEELRDIDNIILFASTDATSGIPPEGWKEAAIAGQEQKDTSKARFLTCPQQLKKRASCTACKVCYKAKSLKSNVRFIVH